MAGRPKRPTAPGNVGKEEQDGPPATRPLPHPTKTDRPRAPRGPAGPIAAPASRAPGAAPTRSATVHVSGPLAWADRLVGLSVDRMTTQKPVPTRDPQPPRQPRLVLFLTVLQIAHVIAQLLDSPSSWL